MTPKTMVRLLTSINILVPALIAGIFLMNGQDPHISLALSVAAAMFSFSAVPLFIKGLRDFKHELRKAYTFICTGIVLYGVGQLQFSLSELINLDFWTNSGGVILPYILFASFIFFGMRRFGRILQLKSKLLSPWWAYGSAFLALIIGLFAEIALRGEPSMLVELECWILALVTVATLTTRLIQTNISSRYRNALGWMIVSFCALIFAAAHDIALTLIVEGDNAYYDSWMGFWPVLLNSILFMRAGYTFSKISAADQVESPSTASSVDVITYVAGLVSNPKEIDVQLDALREITATRTSDAPLSSQQEATLAAVYKKLEEYLVKKERLQNFTRDSLRQMIRNRFQITADKKSTFWSLFNE